MRIQHNISALNAANRLKSNDNAISKNIAKLSSGYRINSAADDAAGLAVSEKMRAQINGLNQAQDNAQNGIALVQTAEGGLNETESILQRMNTLAVESSNGTYKSDTDRANLNKEIEALKSEVDRISTSTNFNQINLLDGSLGAGATNGMSATVQLASAVTAADTIQAASTNEFQITTNGNLGNTGDVVSYTISYTDSTGVAKSVTALYTVVAGGTDDQASVASAIVTSLNADADFSAAFTLATTATPGQVQFTARTAGVKGAAVTNVQQTVTGTNASDGTLGIETLSKGVDAYDKVTVTSLQAYNGSNADSSIFTVNGVKFAFITSAALATGLGTDVNYVVGSGAGGAIQAADSTAMSKLINSKTGLSTTDAAGVISFQASTSTSSVVGSLTLQIGSDNKADQRVSLSVKDMSAKGLGIDKVSIATQADAEAAIDTIKTAINTVSATRADLGALQNRLEHTSNNLSTMSENLTSAESNIRDVDMSDEYVQYSKNQILAQAATSMLAQANSQPQNVLTLLKG
ncbi:MAG TPA: flagellin [Caproicibacter sp.]|nr:flagellin [Caproicibacter sp.]